MRRLPLAAIEKKFKMKFIPFEKFTINSKIGEVELNSRLSKEIEPKKSFRIDRFSNKELKPYEGEIKKNFFKINRIIKYRNPFLPIINGKFITQYGGGSKIEIIMRINYLVFLFMLLFTFAPTLFFLSFSKTSNKSLIPTVTISIVWFFIGYLFTYFHFNYEREKSKLFLINLFNSVKEKSSE